MNQLAPAHRACPVYVIIGTRGQFTKTAPVLRELDRAKIPYRLVNTGQHTNSSVQFARLFGIRAGDYFVTRRDRDIEKAGEAILWFCKALALMLLRRKSIFKSGKGIAIIHGDTMSTLLALIVSRLCGLRVAHIESGLRSFSAFHPFPEEIIRIFACRFSHYLFAPSETAYDNLSGYAAEKYNSQGNTVFDAIRYVEESTAAEVPEGPYCVTTIHRSEVLFNDGLFRAALSAVYKATQFIKVVFVVHHATRRRLQDIGDIERLENTPNIVLRDYYDYPRFMALVKKADFVMTDGGGLQEETYYLNVPCLILRKRTERNCGLGTTALLSELKQDKIDYFLANYAHFRRKGVQFSSPSQIIVQELSALL
jgi:UDP-N-acetylglucosamine 2-epimerase (non-hydrolysing)